MAYSVLNSVVVASGLSHRTGVQEEQVLSLPHGIGVVRIVLPGSLRPRVWVSARFTPDEAVIARVVAAAIAEAGGKRFVVVSEGTVLRSYEEAA